MQCLTKQLTPVFVTNPISIKGLYYIPDFVTEDEEKKIMSCIDSNKWCTAISRRTQHYGYVYYETRCNIPEIQPVQQPEAFSMKPLQFIIERLIKLGIFPKNDPPTQILVNEYIQNKGISLHVDSSKSFGDTIVGLSLLAPCFMTFRHVKDEKLETKIVLERRSLYVLKDEARFDWKHGITKMKHLKMPNKDEIVHRDQNYRRVSLTIRKILTEGTKKITKDSPKDPSCTW